MTWPHATDYNAAVQNPQLCFRDEDLRQGQAVGDMFGLPRPHSGNFADVYQIQGADGQSWAVKCFTRPVSGLRPRYHAISEHLKQTQRAFMVEFHFLDEGICIQGQWYPLVKMRWVEGFRLNEFLREQLNKPVLLERLGQLWVRLAQELRDADMAHGDLQHGNVLLVPGSKSSSLALRLIDYDGMYVPSLANWPSGEIGHPNYQHPQRLREGGYHRHMDRFAHLLIYTALRGLRLGGEELWQRYDNQENLLFREEDFRRPSKSRLLRELWECKDHDVRSLTGHLLLAAQGPLARVPALDELVDESGIRPLSDREEARIDDLLNGAALALSGERGRVRAPKTIYTRSANARESSPGNTRGADATPLASLTDTQPIVVQTLIEEKAVSPGLTGGTPVPPPPILPRRRSSAEIDLDAQPPAPRAAVPRGRFDVATLVDLLVAILSRPGWLAALGVLALASFLIVNVMVWTSVKHPKSSDEAPSAPVSDDRDDKSGPPGVREEPNVPETRTERDRGAGKEEQHIEKRSAADAEVKPGSATQEAPPRKVESETPKVRFTDRTPKALVIEAGETGELRVFLDRGGYRGEVELRLEDLPDGAVAEPVLVPADKDSIALTVEIQENTAKGDYPLRLRVRVKDAALDERPIALTVQPRHDRQERVGFETVDHAHLVGTLYHGWKGKKGMTVLMLHDLHRNRNTPGWRRLAEALQAEGHTVLTFDFRGHGDSKTVGSAFWSYSVNKYLPVSPETKRANRLQLDHLPYKYLPWLIEDIAAARNYLDLCHDEPDGPVNTFNLVLIGAGQASALGSLWLASEGLRFNAADMGDKIVLKPPEKLSVRQAVWIGMEDPLKLNPFGVHGWLRDAHAKPVVPITFIYGEDDVDATTLLSKPIREKLGQEMVLRKTRLSGQHLLDDDVRTARQIHRYLEKTLVPLPPVDWVPRRIKTLWSYWALPVRDSTELRLFVTAKRPGQESLGAVPMRQLGIPVEGAPEVTGQVQKLSKP